jgi:hypothetical protein
MFLGAKAVCEVPQELVHLLHSNYDEALREEVPIVVAPVKGCPPGVNQFVILGEINYVEEFLGYLTDSMNEYNSLLPELLSKVKQ